MDDVAPKLTMGKVATTAPAFRDVGAAESEVAAQLGLPKRDVYQRALALKDG